MEAPSKVKVKICVGSEAPALQGRSAPKVESWMTPRLE